VECVDDARDLANPLETSQHPLVQGKDETLHAGVRVGRAGVTRGQCLGERLYIRIGRRHVVDVELTAKAPQEPEPFGAAAISYQRTHEAHQCVVKELERIPCARGLDDARKFPGSL
jgi:hypothetical protein